MSDRTVFDDGVCFTSMIQLRLPSELVARIENAASREGLALAEIAR